MTLVFDGSDLRGQAAGSQHTQFGAQFDLFAELVQQLFFALEAAGFHKQGHFVDAAGVGDFDLPTLDFFKAAHDLFNLMRVHKHAHDAGGGVHAAHNAAKARAGAAAGAGAAVNVRKVARGKADERVGLVEGRHHDFAHFAVLQRDARVRMADFHVAAVGNVQARFVEAFVADAAHVGGAVALTHDEVVLLFHLGAHLFRQALAGDKGHFEEKILAQVEAFFFGFLRKVHEKAGRAHIAGDAELLHDVELGGGVCGAGGNNRAAQIAQRLFKHEASGRQLVVERVLHGVAGAEANGIEGFGVTPVVFSTVFGIEDGPRRQKDALELSDILGQQTAQARPHGLKEDKFFLLQDGNVLYIGKCFEFLHIELRTVEAFFNVF